MFGRRLRNYFFAGLFAILPLTITVYIIFVGFRWVDGILGTLIKRIFGHSLPGVGLLLILILITLAGVVATNLLGRRLVSFLEGLIVRIPVVGNIYGTTKQITEAISSPEKAVFRSVVLIEYPRKGLFSPGFKVGEPPVGIPESPQGVSMVTVFVPTVPNPATGFIVIVPEDEVITLPMSIEDGVKYIISAGVVHPDKSRV